MFGWVASQSLAGCGGDPEALAARARVEWTSGRHEQAEAALEALAKARPLTTPERLLRAQVARDRGRVAEAIDRLGLPDANTPRAEAAVLASTRGTLELAAYRFRDAETSLLEAVRLDPTRVEARRELINLYALQGRRAELSAAFQALAAPGLKAEALSFADLFLWTLGRREDVGPPELAEALAKAVAFDPNDRPSRLALAENLRRLGRLDEADGALKPLPADDPDARAARARLALDSGERDEAERLLTAAPAGHPASAGLLSQIALTRGDARSALQAARAALATDPRDRDAQACLGQALRLAGDDRAAAPLLKATRDRDRLEWLVQNARPPALRADPERLREIGDACLERELVDVSRAWYQLALAANPLDSDLQKRLHGLDARRASTR